MENRTTFVDPVYPPIAKAAHVTGTVVLQLEIEPDGTVGQVKIISGPEMLKATSVDAVKQWQRRSNGQQRTSLWMTTPQRTTLLFKASSTHYQTSVIKQSHRTRPRPNKRTPAVTQPKLQLSLHQIADTSKDAPSILTHPPLSSATTNQKKLWTLLKRQSQFRKQRMTMVQAGLQDRAQER